VGARSTRREAGGSRAGTPQGEEKPSVFSEQPDSQARALALAFVLPSSQQPGGEKHSTRGADNRAAISDHPPFSCGATEADVQIPGDYNTRPPQAVDLGPELAARRVGELAGRRLPAVCFCPCPGPGQWGWARRSCRGPRGPKKNIASCSNTNTSHVLPLAHATA